MLISGYSALFRRVFSTFFRRPRKIQNFFGKFSRENGHFNKPESIQIDLCGSLYMEGIFSAFFFRIFPSYFSHYYIISYNKILQLLNSILHMFVKLTKTNKLACQATTLVVKSQPCLNQPCLSTANPVFQKPTREFRLALDM